MLLKKKDIDPEMRKNNAADRKIMSNTDSFPSSPYARAEPATTRETIKTKTDKSTATAPFFGHPIHAALAVSCSSNNSSISSDPGSSPWASIASLGRKDCTRAKYWKAGSFQMLMIAVSVIEKIVVPTLALTPLVVIDKWCWWH
jgi:hypothetical protein